MVRNKTPNAGVQDCETKGSQTITCDPTKAGAQLPGITDITKQCAESGFSCNADGTLHQESGRQDGATEFSVCAPACSCVAAGQAPLPPPSPLPSSSSATAPPNCGLLTLAGFGVVNIPAGATGLEETIQDFCTSGVVGATCAEVKKGDITPNILGQDLSGVCKTMCYCQG
ncbi:MAG: hypothetical protein L6R41_005611 [Letrouitia leprolyta]|nr:MAG: hypothetical protein L6R41_005611 [Letrouitia leprolyta]